jgi:hypothetical protein
MMRSFASVRGCTISANDGVLGELADILFHDRLWLVRSLAVSAGDASLPCLVPVSPACYLNPSGIRLGVALSAVAEPGMAKNLAARSARSLAGYHIYAVDGPAGRLDDLVLDDAGWWIPSLVVNTQTLLPGTVHLVPTMLVRSIDSITRRLHLRARREEIGRLPVWGGVAAADAMD